jgi:hypothetical protein
MISRPPGRSTRADSLSATAGSETRHSTVRATALGTVTEALEQHPAYAPRTDSSGDRRPESLLDVV